MSLNVDYNGNKLSYRYVTLPQRAIKRLFIIFNIKKNVKKFKTFSMLYLKNPTALTVAYVRQNTMHYIYNISCNNIAF